MNLKGNRSCAGTAQSKSLCSTRNVIIAIASIAIGCCFFISSKSNMQKPMSQPSSGTKGAIVEQSVVDPLAKTTGVETHDDTLHVVFSTDCTYFQDWQSLLVFHSAVAVGQKGQITRIASGCDAKKEEVLVKLYAKLFPQYSVHFTPDFKTDKATKAEYGFYNKPYGVEHWLENAQPAIPDGVVIAILDPDMIFLRPLTAKIQTESSLYLNGAMNIPDIVKKGSPSGQLYGLDAPWARVDTSTFNRTDVCGPNSPCLKVTEKFGKQHFSVGPPYILERSDLHRLVKSWANFVPRVYKRFPELLAEMYAYAMAAAHEELPHFILRNYMLSNIVEMYNEGWPWVDELGDDVCRPPVVSSIKDPKTGIPLSAFLPMKSMPILFHYCQFFRVGDYEFHKRFVRTDMLKCDGPMMHVPPPDLGTTKTKTENENIVQLTDLEGRRSAFAINIIHRSINSMLHYYKDNMCPAGYNHNKTIINVIKWSETTSGKSKHRRRQ